MATVPRRHGSAHGVVRQDRTTPGSGDIAADELVIADGPPRDFFKISVLNGTAAVDLRSQFDIYGGPPAASDTLVDEILYLIGTRATIDMYQVEGDATGVMSVAVYPTAAWTTATLQTAVRALGSDVDDTTVTSSGLEFV